MMYSAGWDIRCTMEQNEPPNFIFCVVIKWNNKKHFNNKHHFKNGNQEEHSALSPLSILSKPLFVLLIHLLCASQGLFSLSASLFVCSLLSLFVSSSSLNSASCSTCCTITHCSLLCLFLTPSADFFPLLVFCPILPHMLVRYMVKMDWGITQTRWR